MQNKLTFASLRNKAGKFVAPSLESTTAAGAGAATKMPDDLRVSLVDAEGEDAYPIAGFTYLLVYQEQKDAAKGKVLASFVKWACKTARSSPTSSTMRRCPTAVVEKVDKKLAALVGPDGKPLLAPSP